ncbi:hypothetical protein CCP3SC1AL1_1420005 [Gammaproteobacteria bacterium]
MTSTNRFEIVHTLQTDTRRYQYSSTPKVIDLGLRLEDISQESNENAYPKVTPKGCAKPDIEEECSFLVEVKAKGGRWASCRIEYYVIRSACYLVGR